MSASGRRHDVDDKIRHRCRWLRLLLRRVVEGFEPGLGEKRLTLGRLVRVARGSIRTDVGVSASRGPSKLVRAVRIPEEDVEMTLRIRLD